MKNWIYTVLSAFVYVNAGCVCQPDVDDHVTTGSSTTAVVDDTVADTMTDMGSSTGMSTPAVGDPCSTQDDCGSVPGGLYCVLGHNVCSVSCVSDADCAGGVAGSACVVGWCGLPCDELSPHQCWLLDPSAQCITAADREMCGYL